MVTKRTSRRPFAIACIAALAALGCAVGGTAAATTDIGTAEAAFVDEITLNNATLPGQSTAEMITAGHATCDHLRAGVSVLDEQSAVERLPVQPGHTVRQRGNDEPVPELRLVNRTSRTGSAHSCRR